MNFAPTYSGALPATSVKRYTELGAYIRGCYGSTNLVGEVAHSTPVPVHVASGVGATIVLPLASAQEVARVVLSEDLTRGQRIRSFTLAIAVASHDIAATAASGGGRAVSWTTVMSGASIGHKRIVHIDLNGTKVRHWFYFHDRLALVLRCPSRTVRFTLPQLVVFLPPPHAHTHTTADDGPHIVGALSLNSHTCP